MIESRVKQNSGVVPSSRLDPNGLMHKCALSKQFVGDHNGCEVQGGLSYTKGC